MLTTEELLEKSAAYQYGYQDATEGNVPLNLWAGDDEYKRAADDYELGCADGYRDLALAPETDA